MGIMVLMIRDFRGCWRALALTGMLCKVIVFVLLAPLVGLLLRLFVAISGKTVLADVDIISFFVHPIGWVCFVIVGGGAVGILAWEQAALMSIARAARDRRSLASRQALRLSFQKAPAIFYLTSRMAALLLLRAVPFLVAGGVLYFALLTEHDINYYLAKKPPNFWVAAATIGLVLATLITVLFRSMIAWSLALPLVLFEGAPVQKALRRSRDRTIGDRTRIGGCLGAWFVAGSLLSAAGTGCIALLGSWTIPVATGSVVIASLTVGAFLLLWALVHVVIMLLGTTTFAIIMVHLYFVNCDRTNTPLTEFAGIQAAPYSHGFADSLFRLSRRSVFALSALALLVSTLIGIITIHSINLEDRTQITAHRGASGQAPENTLASFRRAIEDRADWVELDVQESKDGVVIVAHDSDLKKVSGADVKIWEATADELRAIDIGSYFDAKFKDERVPTLLDVLQTCKGKVRVNIELKYYGHDQNLEQRVIDLVEAAGMESDVVIMSLNAQGIQKVKSLRPSWTVGLLTAVVAGDLTRAKADFLAVKMGIADPSFIRTAHRRGKDVLVWTVNDRIAMSTMMGRGAYGIITDNPALARTVLAERAEMSPLERLLLELALFLGAAPKDPPDSDRP